MKNKTLEDWLQRSNSKTLYHLLRQARTGPGLVPFLGAGISTAYGFKDWRNLLMSAAPPRIANLITNRLDRNKYEEAAELLLRELNPDGFQNMVAAFAGDSNLEACDLTVGSVSLLPLLANGPVVTTNFDRILERTFEINGAPFKSIISGPRPDLIVDALHGNRRVLIKLHGDWQDRVGRTFAKSDYDANYGDAQPQQKRVLLDSAEELLFSSRSLLFIGASLAADRTVKVLQKVHQRYAGIRHFAIVAAPTNLTALAKKEQHLASCGVLPLWYQVSSPPDHSAKVEGLLADLVERTSVQKVEKPPQPVPSLSVSKSGGYAPKLVLTTINPHYDRVINQIEEGRLNFFLGAAIHQPTTKPLMASHFYRELARLFECEALLGPSLEEETVDEDVKKDVKEDVFAVAQYIADRHGRDTLYHEIRKLFARTDLVPKASHEFFAAWSQFRVAGKQVPYPTVFTTNYDDTLERRLSEAGQPYHLLSYQSDGAHRGLFYHRAPNDQLRIIERPQNIRRFTEGFVIVKLNGGLDAQGRIPESYCTTRLDYWDLAARIPAVFPAAIKRIVSENPLLFLGHGLAAPDIESFVRYAHKNHPGPRSWAVVKKETNIEYWRQCGVEVVKQDINDYMRTLHHRMLRGVPVQTKKSGHSQAEMDQQSSEIPV